jgi:hypothetical protein
MTQPSVVNALRQTELSGLGLAPLSVRGWVAAVWVAACAWMGHAVLIAPAASMLEQTTDQGARLDQRAAAARQAIEQEALTLTRHQQAQRAHRRARQSLTRLSAQHAWLAEAQRQARQWGVQVHALRPNQTLATPNDGAGLADRAWADPIEVDWVLSQQGLDFFDVELVAQGSFASVMGWFNSAQTPTAGGRVAPHWVDIRPADGAGVHVHAHLRVLGLPGTDGGPSPQWSAQPDPDTASAVAWQSPGPGWWRALPLARLQLVGIGRLNERSWAWVIDPTGALRALGEGSRIGPEGRSVMAIEPDRVVLSATDEQPAQDWTWP